MIKLNELNFADRNLLENWYQNNAFKESEPFIVQFVYFTLESYFGKEYFFVKAGTDKPLEKISWIFGLLSGFDKRSSLYALADICNLIQYMRIKAPQLIKGAEGLKKNPRKLRAFFYELFIYRVMDENEIVNKKLVDDDGQELEGTCNLDGREFLFECKKVFLPDLELLDISRRLMEGVIVTNHSVVPVAPNIYQFNFKRPVSVNQLPVLIKKYNDFVGRIENRYAAVAEELEDECANGSLTISRNTKELLEQVRKVKNYDVLCVFDEPVQLPDGQISGRFGLFANFAVAQSKIYKKLEDVLKKVHRQHRDSVYENRIIFIDSESMSEFQMGVFQNENMFDLEWIKRLHKKMGLTEILCITRKEFTDTAGLLAVNVITPEGEESMEKIIKDLFQPMFNKAMRFG